MDFNEARQEVERARRVSDLTVVLRRWRDESGVTHLVYHVTDVPALEKKNPLLLLTYDDAWVTRYVEQDYFRIDPVVQAGCESFLPVDWMTVEHQTSEARHFFKEAETHGIGRHGMTIPIRGPVGERALFTINAEVSDEYWHRWRFSYLRDMHLLAKYFHDRAMRLSGLRHEFVFKPLAARERQCLQYLTHGQTPGQIAASLDLSLSAVHAYLRSARMKLECATVEQAIAKAIRLEILR